MSYLSGALPVRVSAEGIPANGAQPRAPEDVTVQIGFSDGSVGTLLYLTNGDSSIPKEYCEIFGGGKTAIMDNFVRVTFHADGRRSRKRYDGKKGHAEEVEHFLRAIEGKEQPAMTFESLYKVSRATLSIVDAMQQHATISV
jgi:predicted dehydrogenase